MRGVAALVAVAFFVALCGAGLAGAADNPALLDFEPRDVEADPGDTVTVDVTLQAISAYDDEGVESVAVTVAYDPEVLAFEAVERGPWLEGEGESGETTVTSETAQAEPGRVTVEQAREPPAGGTTGTGTVATITFAVAPDAPPANAMLQFEAIDVQMLEYPLPAIDREGVIRIDGGGEELRPLEDADDSDEPGVTLAEEPSGESGADGNGAGAGADGDGDGDDGGDGDEGATNATHADTDADAEAASDRDDPDATGADPDRGLVEQAGLGAAVGVVALLAVTIAIGIRVTAGRRGHR